MLIHRSIAVALIAGATPLVAQNALCSGPGVVFGVTGYQCANCSFRQEPGGRATYTFFAEPVVTETSVNNPVEKGDVIVAVDGSPITTQLGADKFAYASAGAHRLTVRRGREQREVHVDLHTSCVTPGGSTNVGTGSAASASSASSNGRGVSSSATTNAQPLYIVDGVPVSNAPPPGSQYYSYTVRPCGADSTPTADHIRIRGTSSSGRDVSVARDPIIYVDGVRQPTKSESGPFGFAIDAQPVCKVTESDGRRTYTHVFKEYPSIYAVRPGSPADKAGLRVGDVILKVDGESVLTRPGLLTIVSGEGSDVILKMNQSSELHMTVRRDGKEINVVMVVTP